MEHNRPYSRNERVSNLIKKELSQLFLREMDFAGSLVTITDVVVTKKLDSAKVMVSVLPSEKADGVLSYLNRRQPHLQRELLRKISIKPMPELLFRIDHGPERAASIEKTLLDS